MRAIGFVSGPANANSISRFSLSLPAIASHRGMSALLLQKKEKCHINKNYGPWQWKKEQQIPNLNVVLQPQNEMQIYIF